MCVCVCAVTGKWMQVTGNKKKREGNRNGKKMMMQKKKVSMRIVFR